MSLLNGYTHLTSLNLVCIHQLKLLIYNSEYVRKIVASIHVTLNWHMFQIAIFTRTVSLQNTCSGRLQLIKARLWSSDLLGPDFRTTQEDHEADQCRGTKGHASDLLEQSCNPETFMGYSRNIVHCVAGSAKEAWVGVHRATGSWTEVVQWMSNWAKKKFGTGAILSCIFAMLVPLSGGTETESGFKEGYNADRVL
ncbi:hypothetical protein RDI58_017238 [Solanum bulbocastanum]|uniref:Uncharacterized protein n=1 Tax=Solanum bulbocastanum TaxID=147425 RepID=A0AAN8TBZ1_SOLBU